MSNGLGCRGEGRVLPLSVQRGPWRVPDTRGDLSTLTPSMWRLLPLALLLLGRSQSTGGAQGAGVQRRPPTPGQGWAPFPRPQP